MRTLIVGSGAREDSIAWSFAHSPHVTKVYVAPGNGGTNRLGIRRVPIIPKDHESFGALANFAREKRIGFIIVGPDHLIEMGLVDFLRMYGFAVLGPTRSAGELEWWKPYAKEFMKWEDISTAPFRVFNDYHVARGYLERRGAPMVIKAAGLALGKGVLPCKTIRQAQKALYALMVRKTCGIAGETVVIEEFLNPVGLGEFSAHALCSGQKYALFPMSQDHKYSGEGDTGRMTGGTGVVLPVAVPKCTRANVRKVLECTLAGMERRGRPYDGLMYPGFMQTSQGPLLLEYNARGGDPEMPAYMRHLKSDAFTLFYACARGDTVHMKPSWHRDTVANIVLMSRGYPKKRLDLGHPITGIVRAERVPGVEVFYAGVERTGGKLYNSGGRVLNVTAKGSTLSEALERAYEAADIIRFEGKYCRRDIGQRALFEERAQRGL